MPMGCLVYVTRKSQLIERITNDYDKHAAQELAERAKSLEGLIETVRPNMDPCPKVFDLLSDAWFELVWLRERKNIKPTKGA